MRRLAVVLLILVAMAGCVNSSNSKMNVSWSVNQTFREKYTCRGADINPQVEITASPGIRRISLLLYDPDARNFIHWNIPEIPVPQNGKVIIPENTSRQEFLKIYPGSATGKNSFGKDWYNGPCPPSGIHRYVLRVCGGGRCVERVGVYG